MKFAWLFHLVSDHNVPNNVHNIWGFVFSIRGAFPIWFFCCCQIWHLVSVVKRKEWDCANTIRSLFFCSLWFKLFNNWNILSFFFCFFCVPDCVCVCLCEFTETWNRKKITLVIFNAYYDGLLFLIHTMAFPYIWYTKFFMGFSIVWGARIGIIEKNQRQIGEKNWSERIHSFAALIIIMKLGS